jgi:hypothetical protein
MHVSWANQTRRMECRRMTAAEIQVAAQKSRFVNLEHALGRSIRYVIVSV